MLKRAVSNGSFPEDIDLLFIILYYLLSDIDHSSASSERKESSAYAWLHGLHSTLFVPSRYAIMYTQKLVPAIYDN